MQKNSRKIVISALVAGVYAVVSVLIPFSSGALQLRVAEGLTLLPVFMPEAVAGVFIGALITNILTGCAIYDIVFGSLITLISAILTFAVGKAVKNEKVKFIAGGVFPVVLNALLLPLIWYFSYGKLETLYILQVLELLVSQSISVYLVGGVLCYYLKKYNVIEKS